MLPQSPATAATCFRIATAADVDDVVALVESAYRGDASRAGWTTEADLLDGRRTGPDEVTEMIAGDVLAGGGRSSVIVLGEREGALVGCAHLRRDGDAAWFGMFAVRPGLQGAGIGRAMLGEAERIARERWGCREMRMSVISVRKELIGWYLRRGYQRSGQYAPFPYGDERFGIPRRDDLRFEVLCKTLQAG